MDVLTAFWQFLWSITVQTHSNIEFIWFVWEKSKKLLKVMSAEHLSTYKNQSKGMLCQGRASGW